MSVAINYQKKMYRCLSGPVTLMLIMFALVSSDVQALSFLGAQNLLFERRFEEAAEAFEKLLAEDPGNERIIDNLVRCYNRLAEMEARAGNTDQEMYWYRRAVQTAPEMLDSHLSILAIFHRNNDVDGVLEKGKKIQGIRARNQTLMARVHEYLAWAYLEKDDLDNAIKAVQDARRLDFSANRYFDEVERRKARYAEELIVEADAAAGRNDFALAEDLYKRALVYAPTSARNRLHQKLRDVSARLVEIRTRQRLRERMSEYNELAGAGRWEEARDVLELMRDIESSEEIERLLANAQQEVERIQREREMKSESQRRQERIEYLLKSLERVVALQEWPRARMILSDLRALNCPEDRFAHLADEVKRQAEILDYKERAIMAFRAENYASAARLYAQYLEHYPEEYELLPVAARAYLKAMEFDNALELYQEAAMVGYAEFEDMRQMAELHIRAGNVREAISVLEQLHAQKPEDLSVGMGLYRLYMEVDMIQTARMVLQGMVPHMNTDFARKNRFYEKLGDLYAMDGQHRRAMEHYYSNISANESGVEAYRKLMLSVFHFIGVYLLYFIINVAAAGCYICWYFIRGV